MLHLILGVTIITIVWRLAYESGAGAVGYLCAGFITALVLAAA